MSAIVKEKVMGQEKSAHIRKFRITLVTEEHLIHDKSVNVSPRLVLEFCIATTLLMDLDLL